MDNSVFSEDICLVSGETSKEERVNHRTHLIGLFLSVIGLPFLVIYSSLYGDTWHIISYTVYGVTLVLLYIASTFYHGCKTISRKSILRVVDHACIYLLIAGSYTPFTLGPLRESNGWALLSIEWVIAIVGILFKIFAFSRFQIVSLVSYLVMGWLVIFSWPALTANMSWWAISLVAAGGAFYTLGTVFFVWESLRFNHAIWHVFVLSGSACHYCAVLTLLA
jgi:hemolysin III